MAFPDNNVVNFVDN